MVLRGCGISRLELDRRFGVSTVRIAFLRVGPPLRFVRFGRRARRIEGRAGCFLVVGHLRLLGRLARGFVSFGDNDADDLTLMPDFVVLERRGGRITVWTLRLVKANTHVLVSHDVDHTGHRTRFGQIKCLDAAARDPTRDEISKRGIEDGFVGRIPRSAGDFSDAVDSCDGFAEFGA